MDTIKKYFKKRHLVLLISIIVVVAIVFVLTSHGSSANFQSVAVTSGNVVERVSVTGAVSPINSANLAFEKSGVISQIYVGVGQSVYAGASIASLDSASDEAILENAKAVLADMTSNSSSASSSQIKTSSAQTSISNANQDAVNAAHSGFAEAQSALVNYTDSFFSNPQSQNPTIILRTDSPSIANNINFGRLEVSDALSKWSAELASSNIDSAPALIDDSRAYLATLKQFMSELSTIVSVLSPINSGLSTAQITTTVATMNSGLSTLNAAVDSITAAQSKLSLAGNSSDAIAAQMAKVKQAQAALAEDTIISPIDGIVTRADPNVGEFVAAGSSGFAVQSNGAFKIDAFVPEADIAKVALGNLASTTLDAYGSDVDFPAKVIAIDPAETVIQGVPTYKVTLEFVQSDARVRSGMTANLEILTHEALNVMAIPYRAVIDNNGAKSVRVVNKDSVTFKTVPVTTGLKGSDGTIEIDSGLNVGDKVVTYIQGQ